MKDITMMTRNEKVEMSRGLNEAAKAIIQLVGAHCDMYHFYAEDLLADVMNQGISLERIADAVAIKIHEIPDSWDARIDKRVYAWAEEMYIDRGHPWYLNFGGMHSVYLNTFAECIIEKLRG